MKQSKLKGFWRITAFLFFSCFLTLTSFAQQKTLSGTVIGEDGVPIPGVTLVVKGTTLGTVTDMDGKFSFSAPANAKTLSIAYVGMKSQELPIGTQSNFKVTMLSESTGVDEVVVIGYGTRKKEEITGSISTVSDKQMKISSAPSIVSRMQGQISGVTVNSGNTPGSDAVIRIHGIGTINNSDPLYVIDGVPVGPGNNINPNDVEAISVLKDASSAAIYGSRGANGVVLITTKHGRANQEPSITLSVRTGISQATNQYDMLNTEQYGQALWMQAKNLGKVPGTIDTKSPLYYSNSQYGNGASPAIPDYVLPAGATEGNPAADAALYHYPDYQIFKANKQGTNWFNEIYRTGIVQEYDLSIAGGGAKSTYSLSGNYLDEQGILINTGFKRYNFRVNADTKFGNWLKVGESISASYNHQNGDLSNNGEGSAISMAYRMQPIVPVYDIKGNFAGTKAPSTGNAVNPVAQLYHAKDNDGKRFRVLGNIYGEATLFKGLTLKSLFGYNLEQWNAKNYVLPTFENAEPVSTAALNVESNYTILWNWSNTVNYNLNINNVHTINVVLGTEAVKSSYQWLTAGRSQYFSLAPDYMQLGSGEGVAKLNDGSGSSWALFSQFGRANYDLMGKYFLEGTVRRDGSSRFGAANRYGIFPAGSAAWEVSKEGFMASSNHWLDILKLRAGWGRTGNDQIGEYNMYSTFGTNGYTAAYNLNGTSGSAIAGFEPSAQGNPNVAWETTETFNLGINASMLDKKLTFAVDAWQRNTSDMLYQLSRPQVLGVATAPFVNIGKMKNTGIDVELGFHNSLAAGKFTYAVNATWSHYKNEIVSLSNNLKEVVGYSERQVEYTRATSGMAYPMFYGYIVDGIIQPTDDLNALDAKGNYVIPRFDNYSTVGHFKYRDLNGDGKITSDKDRTFIGDPHPKFTGGLNVDLGYAGFDLNMFFYGSYGNQLINYVSRWIDYGQFTGGLSHDALYNSWTPTNTSARLPMLDGAAHSQEASTAFIEDGSYLRLKTMRLGYTLPQTMLHKINMKSLRLYVQATNLYTLTNYRGLDPEVNTLTNTAGEGNRMGVDKGAWPTPRQITLGLTFGL